MHGKRNLATDTSGSVLVEVLLTFPIVMILIGGMIEFGAVIFQYNQAVKAMQVGARRAAVSDPIATDMTTLASYVDSGGNALPEGGELPYDASNVVSVSCGAGTTPCDATELARLLTGGDGSCGVGSTGFLGMCDVAPFIGAENIRISYIRSGLGYVGRPQGPIVTIKIELRNLAFDFFLLDDLIPALGSIPFPPFSVSISSEDLSSST